MNFGDTERRLTDAQRVLVFRPGYLGDTVVALPAFRVIADRFTGAEIRVLTQFNEDPKAAPLAQVLERTGLVHGYIRYSPRARRLDSLAKLRRDIREFKPDVLVYLAPPLVGRRKVVRDAVFFGLCGIRTMIGIPYEVELRQPVQLSDGLFEYEGLRLLRCLRSLGQIDLDSPRAFDLKLTEADAHAARCSLSALPPQSPILAFSIGAKVDVKDWGDENWRALVCRLNQVLPNWALVAFGAAIERERSENLLGQWRGPKANLCGRLSVCESAAAIRQTRLFLGHDSGPMHLAAAVGTACVAVFSARQLPGIWYPWGKKNRVIFREIACQGCNLDVCVQYGKACIAAIGVEDVALAVLSALNLSGNGVATASPELASRGL